MREAATKIPVSVHPKILSVVMFGDPGLRKGVQREPVKQFPKALQARLLENCAHFDPICDQGSYWSGMGHHVGYNDPGTQYLAESANFIIMAFRGSPLPAKPDAPRDEVYEDPRTNPEIIGTSPTMYELSPAKKPY